MALRWESKRPDEVRDYRHDWTNYLDGDTIATSTVTVSDDLTLDDDENDTTSVTVWLSGGESGTLGRVTNTITTAGGRTETEVFTLFVSSYPEPLSLDQAKAHLRKLTDDEDALICTYVRAAREWVENWTGRILVRRPITETFAAFGDYLTLTHRPVSALGDVTYTNEDGDETAYEAGVLRTFAYPARVYPPTGATFPTLGTDGGITVIYTAGYAEGEVPDVMVLAMKVLLTGIYANRGGPNEEAEKAAKGLLWHYHKPALA